jgi:hypothetical protein
MREAASFGRLHGEALSGRTEARAWKNMTEIKADRDEEA